MQQVLRQEKKYLIDLPRMCSLRHRLSQVMEEDPHSRSGSYPVRSLYFDTLDDDDYQDKIDGVELRRKIRLRCYGADAPFAQLEMKQKEGDHQLKRSLRMTRADAQRLIEGDFGVLLAYSDPFAAECYALMCTQCYRPKAVVEYQRYAFTAKENKIRITLDHHIIATESCLDIFSPQLLQNSVLSPHLAVLEVKFNGFLLSYVKDIIQSCDRSETSFSKYCISRAVSKHFTF